VHFVPAKRRRERKTVAACEVIICTQKDRHRSYVVSAAIGNLTKIVCRSRERSLGHPPMETVKKSRKYMRLDRGFHFRSKYYEISETHVFSTEILRCAPDGRFARISILQKKFSNLLWTGHIFVNGDRDSFQETKTADGDDQ
jgi:hypothetical protein